MSPRPSRRALLAGVLAAPFVPARAAEPRFVADPFALGVASGYPTPSGFSLWTRLAPIPLLPDGGMDPVGVDLTVEVAEDEAFTQIVHTAEVAAWPELGHSVHWDVAGMKPDRWYFYRFHAGDATSPVGRTRTAPASDALVERLRFAIGSCQHFEQGWYTAHRHLLAEDLDVMVFLGDYIYEASWGDDLVRAYRGGEARTLGDYRVRYAQHRSDPDLQALHGAVPWLVTWDDHEVDNDWAGAQSQHLDPAFLQRRAAAFQAWYEHMPLPRAMVPHGTALKLHTTVPFGRLARFTLLDDRQYRDPQVCPNPVKGGGSTTVNAANCPQLFDPRHSMLGAEQERWVEGVLGASRQQWNLVAQQTLVTPFDSKEDDGLQAWTDGWEGYPAARERLMAAVRRAQNPVVVGGDVHCTYVSDLHLEPRDERSPVVATEFCGTSITSQGWGREATEKLQAHNPQVKYANSWQRGYLAFEVTPRGCTASVRAVDCKRRDAPVETAAKFVVQAGSPGATSA
jgi:alkaline phosphatase D